MTSTASPTPTMGSGRDGIADEVGRPDASDDDRSDGHRAGSSPAADRWQRWWPWLVGVAAGLVTLGPALAPGSLFSLDLVLTPQIPVPHGVWGLGPELPRRLPLMLPAAWLSPIIPGWLTGKAMIVASIAAAFVGVHRMVRDRSQLAAVGSGLLFALNPFMLTRIAAGHLAIVVTLAVLPWCLSTLLRPSDRPHRTFLWCFALAFTGNYGGMISAILVVAGLVNTRGRRAPTVLGIWLVAQLPWLLPGLLVLNQGGALTDASAFTTIGRGVAGKAQILAGHGFWNHTFQVGFSGIELGEQLPVAILAVGLLGLAVVGARELPTEWRWAAAALAGLGAFVAIISSFEYDANPYFALTRNPIGANLRESLRALPLYLVWMAPAAGLGAARIARAIDARGERPSMLASALTQLVRALPLGAAVLLAAPGMWGIAGHLQPAQIPEGWEEVRGRVSAEPGTVAVLPWHEYMAWDLGGTHLVINPWPFYLGGDVLICSDPERKTKCGADGDSERSDPREVAMGEIVRAAKDGQPVADRLAHLGVRWVVFSHVADAGLYDLGRDPDLERVVSAPTVDLYRVKPWSGLVVAEGGGQRVEATSLVEPLTVADGSGVAVFDRAAAPGWRRGWSASEATPEGLVRLPAGSGLIWYWPTLVVFAGYAVCGVGLVWAIRAERQARSPAPGQGVQSSEAGLAPASLASELSRPARTTERGRGSDASPRSP